MSRKMTIALSLTGIVAGLAVGAGAYSTAAAQSRGPPPALAQESPHQTEALLQTVIEEIQRGNPDLSRMEPELQQAMRQQMSTATTMFQELGSLHKIAFVGNQSSNDIYKVTFQNGTTIWAIRMSEGGKIAGLSFQPATPAMVEIPSSTKSLSAPAREHDRQHGMELETDRPGSDYRTINLPIALAKLCQDACFADGQCRAWTYVRPGVQTSGARCWLKFRVPEARRDSCCVAGVAR